MLAAIACLVLFMVLPSRTEDARAVHWSLDDTRGGARLMLWRDS